MRGRGIARQSKTTAGILLPRAAHPAKIRSSDSKKSSFYSFVSQAREKNLLISPGMAIRWYHRGIFSDITAPDLGRLYLAEFNWRYTELGDGDEFVPPTLQPPPKGWEFPLKSKQYLHVNPTSGSQIGGRTEMVGRSSIERKVVSMFLACRRGAIPLQ